MPANTLWTIIGVLLVIVLLFIVIRLITGGSILTIPLPQGILPSPASGAHVSA